MADTRTKQKRREIMQSVKSVNTTPELAVRSLVHRLGYRFRLHYKKLPGKPDLAFPARNKVIFVHGCFWHGHENCAKGKLPKSNLEFWQPKILRNKERDAQRTKEIKSLGWKVLTVWQCELKKVKALQGKIVKFLG